MLCFRTKILDIHITGGNAIQPVLTIVITLCLRLLLKCSKEESKVYKDNHQFVKQRAAISVSLFFLKQ